MNNYFAVVFFSDSKYEKLTAEISYAGQILCLINQDKGPENLEVEFFHDSRIIHEEEPVKFPLDEFVALMIKTKDDLIT